MLYFGFWWALFASCLMTIALYLLTVAIAAKFGVRL